MPVTKVLVVDGHELLRAGVRDLVGTLPGYQLVGEADSARSALYLSEALKPDIVLMALECAMSGTAFVSPTVARSLAALEMRRPAHDVLGVLSEREREIFQLAATSHATVDIARELHLSRKAVDAHISRINRKLGLSDRGELLRLAAGMGLVRSINPRAVDVVRA